MNTSTSDAVRNLAALTMLALLAGCAGANLAGSPKIAGVRTVGGDTITVIPCSPGPHPIRTQILVASDHVKIVPSMVHVVPGDNPYWVTVQVDAATDFKPTATVSPTPTPGPQQ